LSRNYRRKVVMMPRPESSGILVKNWLALPNSAYLNLSAIAPKALSRIFLFLMSPNHRKSDRTSFRFPLTRLSVIVSKTSATCLNFNSGLELWVNTAKR
jgi:gamma-glutamyltranspeptidase